MKTESKKYILPLAMAVTLAAGMWMGHVLSPKSKGVAWNTDEDKYAKVRDIIEILDQRYVDPVNADKVFEETISDMLHKLDPHSNYMTPAQVKAATEQINGKFGGIGVRFTIIRDTISITNVIQQSPSARAGLMAGDRIIGINGKTVAGVKINSDEVMKQLKGHENTRVNVKIWRKGKALDKTLIRGIIPIETIVCSSMLNKEVGYIKLDQFSIESAFEFSRAAEKLKAQGMKKLIFDLRNNGGGVLQAAIEIVDEFLKDGKLIVTTKGMHSKNRDYVATGRGILEDTKVVVLINSNSASASEIVAGALQDNDRAIIMGRRSFGKGLVQEDIILRDQSNLRLTIARYYTPTGRCIQKPYAKDFESYYEDQLARAEKGELYHPDSTLLVDSLKFKTPKGKVVYGGGGIMPDVFIPLDTTGSSWYYTDLRYSPAFQNFAFDFVNGKRDHWTSVQQFKTNFEVSPDLLNAFLNYAEKHLKISRNAKDLNRSSALIKQTLKAEIARQLWSDQGFYAVFADYDNEVIKAAERLRK